MEEKKLNNGVVAKNAITDEECIRVLEECFVRRGNGDCNKCEVYTGNGLGDCMKHIAINALDLIHRLQDDYLKLKERYVKVLGLNEKVITEQKAEIERLTECCGMFERGEIGSPMTTDKMLALEKEKIELQKQVDELKDENTYLKSVADTFQADYKNAKADGVRELLQELIEMEIKLDPLRSGIRYKALIGYAEENGIEVDL